MNQKLPIKKFDLPYIITIVKKGFKPNLAVIKYYDNLIFLRIQFFFISIHFFLLISCLSAGFFWERKLTISTLSDIERKGGTM